MLQYLFPLYKKETRLHIIFLQGENEEKRKPTFLGDEKISRAVSESSLNYSVLMDRSYSFGKNYFFVYHSNEMTLAVSDTICHRFL